MTQMGRKGELGVWLVHIRDQVYQRGFGDLFYQKKRSFVLLLLPTIYHFLFIEECHFILYIRYERKTKHRKRASSVAEISGNVRRSIGTTGVATPRSQKWGTQNSRPHPTFGVARD